VTVCPSTLLVKFVGALLNLLLNRDQGGRLVRLRCKLHHQQPRKGVSIPYIAHLMSVCALVLEAGGKEDQAIAALLHDAVEDQGGLPTLDTIRHLFGKRVANIVKSCSDSTVIDPKKKAVAHKKEKVSCAPAESEQGCEGRAPAMAGGSSECGEKWSTVS